MKIKRFGGISNINFNYIYFSFVIFTDNKLINNKFNLFDKIYYWFFVNNFITSIWLGKELIECPFININTFFATIYFTYFFLSCKKNFGKNLFENINLNTALLTYSCFINTSEK